MFSSKSKSNHYNQSLVTNSLNTLSTSWSAFILITFHSVSCFKAVGRVLFINSSILFKIEASLSSFLFSNLVHVTGFTIVHDKNVSQLIGSYILHKSLSIAFSLLNSKKTTL